MLRAFHEQCKFVSAEWLHVLDGRLSEVGITRSDRKTDFILEGICIEPRIMPFLGALGFGNDQLVISAIVNKLVEPVHLFGIARREGWIEAHLLYL